jgi:Tetratricopeptide repeat
MSSLHPQGFVRVDGQRYDARSQYEAIEADTEIVVVSGDLQGLVVSKVVPGLAIENLANYGKTVHSSFGELLVLQEAQELAKRANQPTRSARWKVGLFGAVVAAVVAVLLVRGFNRGPASTVDIRAGKETNERLRIAEFEKAMSAGRGLLGDMNFEGALLAFARALELMPGNDEAKALSDVAKFSLLMQQGRAAMMQAEYAKAVKAFEAATRLRPDDATSRDLLTQANTARQEQIKADHDQAMKNGTDNLKAKRYPDAIDCFKRARSLMPDDKLAAESLKQAEFLNTVALGRASLMADNPADAVKQLGIAKGYKPDDLEVQQLLEQALALLMLHFERALAEGLAAFKVKNYEAALKSANAAAAFSLVLADKEAHNEAQKLAKDAADAIEVTKLIEEGREALKNNKPGDAVKSLEAAARLWPNDQELLKLLQEAVDARQELYDQILAAGRVDLVFKNYDKAISAANKGLSLIRAGPEAENLLNEAVKARRALYDQILAAGRVDLIFKNYDKAIRAANEGLRLIPAGPEAEKLLKEVRTEQSYNDHMKRGSSALSANRFPDAAREFQAALQDKPGDAQAFELWSEADRKSRDFEQSMSRGKAALIRKDWAGAERAFQAAHTLAPDNAEANRGLTNAKAKRVR